ncbi:hypothetical protein RV15_GL001419 [Enterococcus silesiacus]|uniref:Uncharacterized protein n=1 Tax=Enterococcus silesiacus TaxID=332949 RepID=A0AA91G984_9ENTE|nr:hypothetical protein RV15_GL001419 [Enterococcus silesiacus]
MNELKNLKQVGVRTAVNQLVDRYIRERNQLLYEFSSY